MTQNYAQQLDMPLFLPKLYAIGILEQMYASLGQEARQKFDEHVPKQIRDLVNLFQTSFLVGTSIDNWGDDLLENQSRYINRLGLDGIIVLEAIADPSSKRLAGLVADIGETIPPYLNGAVPNEAMQAMQLAMHSEVELTGKTPLSQGKFLEEQVASQYAKFMLEFYDWTSKEWKAKLKDGWEEHYWMQILHPGIHQGHLDDTVQLWKHGNISFEMDGIMYNIKPLEYVQIVRDEITKHILLKKYLMDAAFSGGINSVTEQTIKEGIKQAYNNRDDFEYKQRLSMHIENISGWVQIMGKPLTKEDVERLLVKSGVFKERDNAIKNMAEAIFNN